MFENLLQEFEYYLQHQDEFVRQYNGKVIVLKDHVVLGVFDSDFEAVHKTSQEHELGTFLVQRCSPGVQDYTAVFHSRVGLPSNAIPTPAAA
jgi:hypothetical protein